MTACKIDFDKPPEVGATLEYYRGVVLTLLRAIPHTRRDGSPSHLLEWQASDGRIGVSGLRGNAVTWQMAEEALGHAVETRAWRASHGDEVGTPTNRKPRPAKPPVPPKVRLGLRIDADVAAGLREQGGMSSFAESAIRAALERLAADTQDGEGT